ncbi:hypothetical protein COLO4_09135 [Corchorus olitorius]|uniref:Tetrapyrrole biosynthesis glutamyl-tRNA reductase dimerisation domain-containing protein n=1 Tax=Corchorus olitorius TaxID=93759 RepID=A0A1R3KD25_9ROSI|nr:hypothetical protein COLO4_09135 [Corchorus olitorius]
MLISPQPNPCSVRLQPKNNHFPLPSLVSIGTGKHVSHIAVISTVNNNPVLQESSSRKGKLFPDQALTTRNPGENYYQVKSGYLSTKQKDDEALGKEVEGIICRLRVVVEKIREMEIEKVMGRFKGTNTMSAEDRLLVENTSREIVDKFLVRPIQYLQSVNGDFEQKLKDLNLLIRMLEKSCLECQR